MCRLLLSCKALIWSAHIHSVPDSPVAPTQILPSLISPHVTLFSLHGRLQSAARTRALTTFASFHATSPAPAVLLTTDVAARGLDIPDVDVVLQFDPPSDSKSFSHRCGRTARAGRHGRATVLLTEEEVDYVGASPTLIPRATPATCTICVHSFRSYGCPQDTTEATSLSFGQRDRI